MFFKYGIKQIKRRPFMNLLILFQFVSSVLLILMVIVKINGYFVVSNTIKNICSENCYRITYDAKYQLELDDKVHKMVNEFYDKYEHYAQQYQNNEISKAEYEEKYLKPMRKLSKKIEQENLNECFYPPDISLLPYIKETYYFKDGNIHTVNEMTSLAYLNKEYIDKLNFRMEDGIWLSKVKNDDNNYINAVAFSGQGYRIGDVIDLYQTIPKKNNLQYKDIKTEYKCKIVGLIDYSYYRQIIEHGTIENDNYLSFDSILQLSTYSLIIEYDESKPLFKDSNTSTQVFLEMSKLNDDITDEQLQEFFSVASKNKYKPIDMKAAYKNTYMRDKKNFQNDMIFLIMASLIAIVCLVGVSALSVSREIKTYSIYILCGMTKKQCIGINAVYISMLITTSAVIAILIKLALAFSKYYKMYTSAFNNTYIKFSDFFIIGKIEIITIIVLLVISFISAMIIPYITLKRLQVITNIKENA